MPAERFEDWAIDRRDTVKAPYVDLLLELAELERRRTRLDPADPLPMTTEIYQSVMAGRIGPAVAEQSLSS